MNTACILTIGDEILLGQILDTNARHIAKTLSDIGIDVVAKLTVGDARERIESALQFAFASADIVLITGGLGPTNDDITKKILADWFHSDLAESAEALAHLEALLRRRGREMNPATRTQAIQPVKAEYVHNQVGTAPGMWFSENGKICVAMPGVPYEMIQILADEVVPRLQNRLKLEAILHRYIRTIGIPESSLAERIADWEAALPAHLRLAYLPGGGQVKLRLTGRGGEPKDLEEELNSTLDKVLPLLADVTYATEDIEIEEVVASLMEKENVHIVLNDQLSGGKLKARLCHVDALAGRIAHGLPPNLPQGEKWAVLSLQPVDIAGFTQQIFVELVWLDNDTVVEKQAEKEMKSFPQAQVNQNMVSLLAIDMLRRLLLDTSV